MYIDELSKQELYMWYGDAAVSCPHCGAENELQNGLFCTRCGKELLNFCTNKNCDNSAYSSMGIDVNARHCPLCGAVSSFSELGYLGPEE